MPSSNFISVYTMGIKHWPPSTFPSKRNCRHIMNISCYALIVVVYCFHSFAWLLEKFLRALLVNNSDRKASSACTMCLRVLKVPKNIGGDQGVRAVTIDLKIKLLFIKAVTKLRNRKINPNIIFHKMYADKFLRLFQHTRIWIWKYLIKIDLTWDWDHQFSSAHLSCLFILFC